MNVVSFNRQTGFIAPADLTITLNIIGVGATGSTVAMMAARMGFTDFALWDPDVVEEHNLPNQMYSIEHVGMNKVDALSGELKRFNPQIRVKSINDYFRSNKHTLDLRGPLVLTVDSMAARKDITDAFAGNPLVEGVFESRVGFDFGAIHIIDNLNDLHIEQWELSLVDDSEVLPSPCGLQICTTLVSMLSAIKVQKICEKYSHTRDNSNWNPPFKILLQLTEQNISVHEIRDKEKQ